MAGFVAAVGYNTLLAEGGPVYFKLRQLEQFVSVHALQFSVQGFAPFGRALLERQRSILPRESVPTHLLALVQRHETLEHSLTFNVQDALHSVHELEVEVLIEQVVVQTVDLLLEQHVIDSNTALGRHVARRLEVPERIEAA